MDKAVFENLLASVKQMDEIARGARKSSRVRAADVAVAPAVEPTDLRATIAAHTLKAGDSSGAGASIDTSEKD